ncbi:DUF1707 SHOCT-like domain-containing protein [Actinomadura flavalba]|uniref:DUF1707 SHOCT-like domain-containing protein n=1 Tax=Actinomadura flavalba TaxID=1120938 RepID=UPI000399DBA6|nr:DUF1707 domain-containing protein [Actinomadura flavalba]
MAPNPEMRASDVDRDRVAASLREHCAVGRITTEELQERIEAVYAARTLGDLDEVTADLPEEDPHRDHYPVPSSQRYETSPAHRDGRPVVAPPAGTVAWTSWAVVSGLNLGVWAILALTGTLVYPWWLWVAGPWGIVLIIGTLARRAQH